jgi:hypothetical protein
MIFSFLKRYKALFPDEKGENANAKAKIPTTSTGSATAPGFHSLIWKPPPPPNHHLLSCLEFIGEST